MQTLLSHFLIPGWLINGLDLECVALLNVVQDCLLQTPLKLNIELVENQLAKDCGLSADHQLKNFSTCLRKFAQMRVNLTAKAAQKVSIPIVNRVGTFQCQDNTLVNFEFTQLGAELLLGFHNPFLKLIHEMKDRIELVYFPTESLFVWKPLWLDLSPKDRRMYLTLETALQLRQSCVHLDGIFSVPFGEFMGGSKNLDQSLKTLRRLGKKCVDHGLFTELCPSDSVILPRDDAAKNGSPFVLFKVNPGHVIEDQNFFVKVSARFFSDTVVGTYSESWLAMTSAGIFKPEIERQFSSLKELMGSWRGYTFRFENWLFDLRLVWIEWFLRSQRGHRFPLPREVLDTATFAFANELFGNFCSATPKIDRAEFAQFSQMWTSDARAHGLHWLKKAILSFAEPKVLQDVASVFQQYTNFEPKVAVHQAAQNTPKNTSKILDVNQAASEFPKNLARTSMDSERSRLRKIALEELRTMVRFSSAEYLQLKEKYFKSLTSDQIKLMQNVQMKMQPTLFDQHLEGRIAQFMMDHPDQWTSAKRSSLIENLSNQF